VPEAILISLAWRLVVVPQERNRAD